MIEMDKIIELLLNGDITNNYLIDWFEENHLKNVDNFEFVQLAKQINVVQFISYFLNKLHLSFKWILKEQKNKCITVPVKKINRKLVNSFRI